MDREDIMNNQLYKQIKHHQHEGYETDIILSQRHTLRGFKVNEDVLRPEKMTSIWLARWLFFNNMIFIDKIVLDLGCGSGIQGVVMALYGAKRVLFSDKSEVAFGNTKENVEKFGIAGISEIFCGDLLEKIFKDSDVGLIVFNHPFFSDPDENAPKSMVDRQGLIHRFFEESRSKFPLASIIMPFYHRAGHINDPSQQALKHGYNVIERLRLDVRTGLQKGLISIYEVRLA
ncbi:MAG: methyltransferase [Candidatus Gribaldobacteria bacterium]|nr:methyltransferase [Candidatus Gribaldobacteria bacterium]